MPKTGDVRVVVADDTPEMRAALSEVISSAAGLVLLGVAGDAREAVSLCRSLHPDVALVDVRMPGGGGQAAAASIRTVSPGTVVLALSAFDHPRLRAEMAAAGAAGYLVKDGDVAGIVTAILAAAPRRWRPDHDLSDDRPG